MLSLSAFFPRLLKPSAPVGKGLSVQNFCLTLSAEDFQLSQNLMTNLILGWLNGRRKSGLSLVDLYHLDEAMGWNGDEGDDIGQVNIVLSSYQLGCLQEMMAYLQLAYYTNPQLGHEGLTNAQVRAGLNRICHAIKLGYWVLDFQDITVLFRHKVKG